jgi:cysteine desulfurase
VLAAMGVAPELAECALRVSLGWSTTQEHMDAFITEFGSILARQNGRGGRAA